MIRPAFILGKYTYYMHMERYSTVNLLYRSDRTVADRPVTQINIDGAVIGVKPNKHFKL